MFRICKNRHIEICFDVVSFTEKCPVCLLQDKVEEIEMRNSGLGSENLRLEEKEEKIEEMEEKFKVIKSIFPLY